MTEPARREVILEVADRLLRHYGPQKTTMADVAREANVGVGSVYLEFPSKDALVEELSRRHYRSVLESMRRASEEAGDRSAGDRLVRVLEARAVAFLAMAEAGAHACDLLHCASDAVKAAKSGYHLEERAILTEVLRAGKEAGELDVEGLESTLGALLSAYSVFTPPWLFKMDVKRLGAELEAMNRLVLRGLLARPAAKKRSP